MVKSVSVLRESKTDAQGREVENRVVLIPPLIEQLINACPGLSVLIESQAGVKIGFGDSDYEKAGAAICSHAEALSQDLVLGVKETRMEDFGGLRDNLFLSFQHFAESRERTAAALNTDCTFIALETMEEKKQGQSFFPCLAPMSEAAAKIVARHADEYALLNQKIITSGLPETGMKGVKVAVVGGGRAGMTAAEEFSERGCEVYLLEKDPVREEALGEYFINNAFRFPKVSVLAMNPENLSGAIDSALFLVSAMYTSGKKAEKMVSVNLVKSMLAGGCVYAIDIDQGGGVEGIAETSILDGFDLPLIPGTAVHSFAPPNLPSLGARTTSEALGKIILPYVKEIAGKGLEQAAAENPLIASGINIQKRKIVHPGLASVFPDLN
jgi:alanine dehydrogenase